MKLITWVEKVAKDDILLVTHSDWPAGSCLYKIGFCVGFQKEVWIWRRSAKSWLQRKCWPQVVLSLSENRTLGFEQRRQGEKKVNC